MRIFTKDRYALRLILDMTLYSHGVAVPLRDMARRQEISDKYLEQIVTRPSRVRLARLTRDAGGGYLLIRGPEEYTMEEIPRVLEGDLAPVSCVDQNDICRCSRADRCVAVEVWRDAQAAVSSVADRLTLVDLVHRYHEKCPGHNAQSDPK